MQPTKFNLIAVALAISDRLLIRLLRPKRQLSNQNPMNTDKLSIGQHKFSSPLKGLVVWVVSLNSESMTDHCCQYDKYHCDVHQWAMQSAELPSDLHWGVWYPWWDAVIRRPLAPPKMFNSFIRNGLRRIVDTKDGKGLLCAPRAFLPTAFKRIMSVFEPAYSWSTSPFTGTLLSAVPSLKNCEHGFSLKKRPKKETKT